MSVTPPIGLLTPIHLGGRVAPNRVLFGPHATNLGRGRSMSERHVAYYSRRARGGAGIIVTEEAAVHPSDWPYERSPLAERCPAGWAAVAAACSPQGALVLAALGHTGGQGSSAYSQEALLAPSRVPEVNSREVPKQMEHEDIAAVVSGFGRAAELATEAGLDGVEVNAGQYSLVRQFLSGLTNQRSDEWGTDRLHFARQVLRATRDGLGAGAVLGLRLSCDELAPWAGLTPEMAADAAVALGELVDYLVVVRGSIFTTSATTPDMHVEPQFNLELCRSIRDALRAGSCEVPVFLQGSVVDVVAAEAAIGDEACDAVEMTRAQIADATLVAKLRSSSSERIRPCLLCNQKCQVRDARNPIVSCVVDPRSGHELDDPPLAGTATRRRNVLVVGAGPAGLEAARVAAARGHEVRVVEAAGEVGGAVVTAAAASGRERLRLTTEWLAAECLRAGVNVEATTPLDAAACSAAAHAGTAVLLATGSAPGVRPYLVEARAEKRVGFAEAHLQRLARGELLDGDTGQGPAAVIDPIGGPIGVSVAETYAARGRLVHLITQDQLAGNELSLTGDLAPANVRLQQAGVAIERRSLVRAVRPGAAGVEIDLEDRFTGECRILEAEVVVDAGFRWPGDALWHDTGGRFTRIGDAVAPRTIHEAILEARRAILAMEASG